MKQSKKNKGFLKLPVLLGLIVVVFIVSLGTLQLTHTIHLFGPAKVKSGTIKASPQSAPATNSTKQHPANSSSAGTSSSVSPKQSSTITSSQNTISATSSSGSSGANQPAQEGSGTLISPWGDFVSDHNTAYGSSEESVCNTSPGATCFIQFTQGATVEKLPTEVANNSGSVYWNWQVTSNNFNTGNWQIEAITTLNGQTQTATDKLFLDISQ